MEFLGEGAGGRVDHIVDLTTKKDFALKEIKIDLLDNIGLQILALYKELEILEEIKSKNLTYSLVKIYIILQFKILHHKNKYFFVEFY